jgi:hypothetical protein
MRPMMPSAGARRSLPGWLEWLAPVTAVVAVCAVHGPLIGYRTFANVDEAYAGALGERLLEGFKLYEGAVSQRGPLMYYAFEALAWLHGWDNIVALRLWALVFCVVHLLGVWWLARTLLSREAAVVATALTGYALTFGFPAFDAYALNGETLQLPALLAATLFAARAVHAFPGSRSRRRWIVAGGISFGAALSVKQSVILHPLALMAWLVVDAHRRKAGTRKFAGDILLLGMSTLAVPLALVAHAVKQGTLARLVFYCFTYNREVHLRPQSSHSWPWLSQLFFRLTEQTSFFVLVAVLVALAAPGAARRVRSAWKTRSLWALGRGFGVRRFLALNFAIALASASTMYRFFPHYFLQAWPFAALCAGAALDRLARSRRWGPSWDAVTVGFVGFVLFCGWLGTVFGEKVDGCVMHDRTVKDVAKLITATTSPDDRIFVWGFSPWLYQYSHRRPAGRFVFETYVTGVVPWFWDKPKVERARIVPGSVGALLDDLNVERPAVVVDAGSIMLARSMRAYAPFANWLHGHYCFDLRLGAFDVYRRKPDGGECVMPWSPRPFGAIDWNGRRISVLLPILADEELTKPLPRGSFFKPIWFEWEPTPAGLWALRDARRDREEAEAAADGFKVEDTDVDWVSDR